MTRVCLVGTEEVNLRYELLSRETARNALATYDLREPFENTVALETVSIGAAVSLLNDLNWYLVRFTDAAFVLDTSISETEWLSRDLAAAVRDDEVDPAETDRFLRIYGIETDEAEDGDPGFESAPRLVEPMLVTRTGDTIPEYDLRNVADTLVVRVTQDEFGA
jgi:hypothetical protein